MEEFQKLNWEGIEEKVCARLSKWTWLLPQLSYRGRVLVANNLVASALWHRLVALSRGSGLVSHGSGSEAADEHLLVWAALGPGCCPVPVYLVCG